MTFIDMYIKYMTGTLGSSIFEFIKQNTLAITSVVAVYGIFITFAAYNGRTLLPRMTDDFLESRIRQSLQEGRATNNKKLADRIFREWGEMIEKLPRYRFIPSKKEYWVIFPNAQLYAEKMKIDKEYIEEFIEEVRSNPSL